jgi:hypothetical protein
MGVAMANIIEKAEDYVSSTTISMEMLRDKLSEFLAVERGGLKLYDEAIGIVTIRRYQNSSKFSGIRHAGMRAF